MKITRPRTDFLIVEDFFKEEQAAEWLSYVLKKGSDPWNGFHHPHLRPNRFHEAPKFGVKKYMCLGFYWNPEDYLYYPSIPLTGVKVPPIPKGLKELSQMILKEFYPFENFSPEAVLVNYYTRDSSLALHSDKDEVDLRAPVIGLSFGSTCRFFYEDEKGVIQDLKLPGNSIYIFGKSARLMKHGVGTNYVGTLSPGSERFLADKERVNLTIRQVFT